MTVTDRAPPRRARPRRRWPWVAAVAGAAGLIAIVFGAGFERDPTVVQSVLLDRPAPPLAGRTLSGHWFDLADHRGKVVLVNVWASWCVPCREEYPVLKRADRQLGPQGLQIVGINTQDNAADAKAFLRELGGENFPSVVDFDGRIAVEWGTFGVPETFIVDRDGRLRAKVLGQVTGRWIAANVVPLLDVR